MSFFILLLIYILGAGFAIDDTDENNLIAFYLLCFVSFSISFLFLFFLG